MITAIIPNAHADLVTDASYDFYGLSLATCGLDQRIKIWTFDADAGQWVVEADWKAHDATITKLSWAHPMYGSVIASGSFDRTAKIWEKVQSEITDDVSVNGASTSSAKSKWTERAVLLEARGSIRAVEFAPHEFGLKLATVSSDNFLRIYECLEQPTLSSWQLVDEVDVPVLPIGSGRPGSAVVHTIAPGTPTPSAGAITALDSASVSNLLQNAQQQQNAAQVVARPGLGVREADGGWCISWCKERYWGEVVAVGCGVSGIVKIVQFSSHRRPLALLALDPPRSSTSRPHSRGGGQTRTGGYAAAVVGNANSSEAPYAVTSVAWAPSCGRSFHLIATGSRDGAVRIWKVHPSQLSTAISTSVLGNGVDEEDVTMDSPDEKWSANLVAEFSEHKSGVSRVEWNITGTVLSSSGNDGRVRLWKQTVGGVWRSAGDLTVTHQEEHTETGDVEMDENSVTS